MTMAIPGFKFVAYIATTPEKLWQALVDTDQMRQYWVDPAGGDPGHINVSDWTPGSPWEHQRLDAARTVDVVGRVIESTAPRRLAYTWVERRPEMLADVAEGWSMILSNLKTLLETGRPLQRAWEVASA
jgi:uncharacterized protein YndB with AHSA1/START domain